MTVVLPDSVINGRFSVHVKPNTAPGKCACCGAVNKPVVDFGFTVDFYGAVFMCGDCIREAHTLLDTVFPVEGSQSQVVPLPTLNVEAINAYVLDAIESINHLRRVLPDDVPSVEDAEELSDDNGVTSLSNAGESVQAEHAHDESVNVERPDDDSSISGVFDLR